MKRVLVVDDEFEMRSMLSELLERNGYDVISSCGGNAAMALCQDKAVDLAVVDIFMPEKDGLETIREMRLRFPSMKIIAISGGSRHFRAYTYLKIAKKFGALYTLTKPFDREEIMRAIQACLGCAQ